MKPDDIFDGGDNLMSEFANWAKKKLGINIDQYMPSAEEFVEGSGSEPVDEYFITNWIADELNECEWVTDINYWGKSSNFTIGVKDGKFRITVEPM